MARGLSDKERAALVVIARHLGVPVVPHDDGSRAKMHDLEIHYPDGRVGAVEVTAAEDFDRRARQGAISKRPVMHEPRLSRGWWVMITPDGDFNTTRRAVANLLVEFETRDISELSQYDGWTDDWARDAMRAAHVQSVKATDLFDPGVIAFTASMLVAWLSTDPDDVVTFVEQFIASRPTDVAKLASAAREEGHLFVWSGVFSEGWTQLRPLGLDVERLPSRAPRLPPGVTHVWVAPEAAKPSRIVHWSPAKGWAQAGTIT